jgi:BirA family biotin operon repressor/biotin-[acetyl-CoA-carboxylase] ligase
MSPADRLDADRLAQGLRGQRIGNRVVVLEEATSTNDVVFAMAADNQEGLVVFAERQTAGRGQHGRRWESAAGQGLWFSVLLRPDVLPNELPRLTSWAAQTVAKTLATELSLPATVKPPNDVYLGTRKVAGVLLEMRAIAGAPNVGILGIGLNVHQTAGDFPEEIRETATSLSLASGEPVDRHAIAISILRDLDRTYGGALAVTEL